MGPIDEKKQQKTFTIGFILIILVIGWFLAKPFISNWRSHKGLGEKDLNAEILKAPSAIPEDVFAGIAQNKKIILVDVSSASDFRRGHIASSINISSESLDKEYLDSVGAEKTSEIYIINQGTDGELAKLAEIVNSIRSDYVNVKYLRGGIAGWREKGFPLVSSGGAETDIVKVKKITVDELKKEASISPGNLQFLDVRGNDAFQKEHIVQAINIPLFQLEMRKKEIPSVKKIIIYGLDEDSTFQAAVTLFDLNFFNVFAMEGDLETWKNAGGNVESGK